MKKVVFICVENSCRSQMAEAFAKMHGKELMEAYSSGSQPSGIVNPKAIAAMRELGYDLSQHSSIGLDKIPAIEYDYAITMGCGDNCPMIKAKSKEDWDLPDPKYMELNEFNRIRDMIEDKVKDLIVHISSESQKLES